jgi:hypothetical protein
MLLQNAPVHDDQNPGFARFVRGFFVNHSFLHPDRRNVEANRFID